MSLSVDSFSLRTREQSESWALAPVRQLSIWDHSLRMVSSQHRWLYGLSEGHHFRSHWGQTCNLQWCRIWCWKTVTKFMKIFTENNFTFILTLTKQTLIVESHYHKERALERRHFSCTLKKISLNFSRSSFAIRANLSEFSPSVFLSSLLLSLWRSSFSANRYFCFPFDLKVILQNAKYP